MRRRMNSSGPASARLNPPMRGMIDSARAVLPCRPISIATSRAGSGESGKIGNQGNQGNPGKRDSALPSRDARRAELARRDTRHHRQRGRHATFVASTKTTSTITTMTRHISDNVSGSASNVHLPLPSSDHCNAPASPPRGKRTHIIIALAVASLLVKILTTMTVMMITTKMQPNILMLLLTTRLLPRESAPGRIAGDGGAETGQRCWSAASAAFSLSRSL